MSYRIEATPGSLKKLRTRAGGHQATFVVPRHTEGFATALLAGEPPCDQAAIVVDNISFPLHRLGPLVGCGPDPALPRDTTISAAGEACTPMLAAALADRFDFWFVPTPRPFVVYVDNDDYATVFAHRQAGLSTIIEALAAAGIQRVDRYERRL